VDEGDRPLILLYIVDAGGGHRAAANALIAAAAEAGPRLRFEVINISRVLAPLDWVRRATGVSLEDTYNEMVRRGMTLGLVPLLRGLQWTIRQVHGRLVSILSADLAPRRPALVVSLAPNFNAPLRDAVRSTHPGVPFVVHLTDYADFPPNFWMVPGVDRLVVGCEEAIGQAGAAGIPAERVVRHSGMPLHPKFYPRVGAERGRAVRRELGIGDEAFVSMLLFGGKGTPQMVPLAGELLSAIPAGHVIAIGGSNPRVVKRLSDVAAREPRLHAFGFSDRVAELMAASDVLVTKPGPGTVAEALHQRVAIVTIANNRTVPQERFNAHYLVTHGFGHVEHSWKDMAARVRRLAEDPLERRAIVERQARLPENHAVFETLDLLVGILRARADRQPVGVA
jgi:UDP-N-acetylglucosamine:LPS N-acetylglucosamine transferase